MSDKKKVTIEVTHEQWTDVMFYVALASYVLHKHGHETECGKAASWVHRLHIVGAKYDAAHEDIDETLAELKRRSEFLDPEASEPGGIPMFHHVGSA